MQGYRPKPLEKKKEVKETFLLYVYKEEMAYEFILVF